ncbi:MAG: NAD(P)H-hydrate dehydratase [Desulfobacterales bacterium]|nr:NAD(P)H-hydrate dehydratase [Desulfobacterales bacterium]
MILVTASEMQEMDRRTIEEFGLPGRVLMENAGRGATRFFLDTFTDLTGKTVAVMAGRGNNGGDGFVMARTLAQQGVRVVVYLLAESGHVRGDAAANLALLAPLKVPVVEMPTPETFARHRTAMAHAHVWIDAILGTGLNTDVREYFKEVIDFLNDANRPVFSVDVPSGLHADTGKPCGAAIRAVATATFAFAKIGHRLLPGAAHTGKLNIVDIGIPPHIAAAVAPAHALITEDHVRGMIHPRPTDAHKGTTGHVLVVAGAPGKTGAAAMAAMAALRAGAGLVTLGIPASLEPIVEARVLEAMTEALPEEDGRLTEASMDRVLSLLEAKQCLALGPGIGTAAGTKTMVTQLVSDCPVPLVIDADGLNCLAGRTEILRAARAPVILTPHPGEMARLMGISTQQVQNDRIGCARTFARTHGVWLVLKGAMTVVAHPDGSVRINPTGNAGMAAGGMGDVLTGLIAGLIAQGLTPGEASETGVFLHGRAADTLARTVAPRGYLASEVMNAIPGELAALHSRKNREFKQGCTG